METEHMRCFGAACREVAIFRVDFLKSCCYSHPASHVYCGEHTARIVKNAEYDNRRLHVDYMGPQYNDGGKE